MTPVARLGLGTVQFGLNYGISNSGGQTSSAAVRDILESARRSGIELLDTAPTYGNSEDVLGASKLVAEAFRVVTKTPVYHADTITDHDASVLVENCQASSSRLGVAALYGLLVHHVDNLFRPGGDKLVAAMEALRVDGLVTKIGASVYDARQIDRLLEVMRPDVVQLPINLLDQRLLHSGHLDKLKRAGVEIHARSLFLQGLLLLPLDRLPRFAHAAQAPLLALDRQISELKVSRLHACLAFGLSLPQIDNVIVGVTTVSELDEIVAAAQASTEICMGYGQFSVTDDILLNPAQWPKS